MNKYSSQVGQDKFLHEKIFKNFGGGVFLDLGAFDGITPSNTYFFEKNLNWRGFCFEPIPPVFKNLKKNRKCKCLNNCIGDKKGVVEFSFVRNNPMFSGISKNLHTENTRIIDDEQIEIIKSKIVAIGDFLNKNKIQEIHILSLDIEGNEEKVLSAINFDNVFIHSICVEDAYNEKKLDDFLKNKGFVLLKHSGFDKIFINKKSKFFPKNSFYLRIKAETINKFYTPRMQLFFRVTLNKFPKTKNKLKKILQDFNSVKE